MPLKGSLDALPRVDPLAAAALVPGAALAANPLAVPPVPLVSGAPGGAPLIPPALVAAVAPQLAAAAAARPAPPSSRPERRRLRRRGPGVWGPAGRRPVARPHRAPSLAGPARPPGVPPAALVDPLAAAFAGPVIPPVVPPATAVPPAARSRRPLAEPALAEAEALALSLAAAVVLDDE